MNRARFNLLLTTLALLGVFAGITIVAHRETSHYAAKLASVLIFSIACLSLTRDRQSWDTFAGAVAGLFTLFAIAMTAGSSASPGWWPLFLTFVTIAALFVILTRKKRETLIGILAIVASRIVLLGVLYVLRS
jgi:hypothetical protein